MSGRANCRECGAPAATTPTGRSYGLCEPHVRDRRRADYQRQRNVLDLERQLAERRRALDRCQLCGADIGWNALAVALWPTPSPGESAWDVGRARACVACVVGLDLRVRGQAGTFRWKRAPRPVAPRGRSTGHLFPERAHQDHQEARSRA